MSIAFAPSSLRGLARGDLISKTNVNAAVWRLLFVARTILSAFMNESAPFGWSHVPLTSSQSTDVACNEVGGMLLVSKWAPSFMKAERIVLATNNRGYMATIDIGHPVKHRVAKKARKSQDWSAFPPYVPVEEALPI